MKKSKKELFPLVSILLPHLINVHHKSLSSLPQSPPCLFSLTDGRLSNKIAFPDHCFSPPLYFCLVKNPPVPFPD
jgi:hypothetical protein